MSQSNDQLQQKILELQQQIEQEFRQKKDLISQKNQENEKIHHIKQEYGKKITEYQVEIENLREYIKRRSQEDQQKRLDEKKNLESEILKHRDQVDQLRKQYTAEIKERDNELRNLKDFIEGQDPEWAKQHD